MAPPSSFMHLFQDGPKMSPRRGSKRLPRGPQDGFKTAQDDSKTAQEARKTSPRGPQDGPRGSQGGSKSPRKPQDGPREVFKTAPKRLQDAPKMPPRCPQGPKRPPRNTNMLPRGPRGASSIFRRLGFSPGPGPNVRGGQLDKYSPSGGCFFGWVGGDTRSVKNKPSWAPRSLSWASLTVLDQQSPGLSRGPAGLSQGRLRGLLG